MSTFPCSSVFQRTGQDLKPCGSPEKVSLFPVQCIHLGSLGLYCFFFLIDNKGDLNDMTN